VPPDARGGTTGDIEMVGGARRRRLTAAPDGGA
jgi:hypothetical protein